MGASWATHHATRDATGLESEASILSIRVTKLFLGPPFLNNPRTCISNRTKKSSLDVRCSQLEERDHQALITSLRAPLNRPTQAIHGGIRIVGCRSCGPVLGIPARNNIARNSKHRERTLRIQSVSTSIATTPKPHTAFPAIAGRLQTLCTTVARTLWAAGCMGPAEHVVGPWGSHRMAGQAAPWTQPAGQRACRCVQLRYNDGERRCRGLRNARRPISRS